MCELGVCRGARAFARAIDCLLAGLQHARAKSGGSSARRLRDQCTDTPGRSAGASGGAARVRATSRGVARRHRNACACAVARTPATPTARGHIAINDVTQINARAQGVAVLTRWLAPSSLAIELFGNTTHSRRRLLADLAGRAAAGCTRGWRGQSACRANVRKVGASGGEGRGLKHNFGPRCCWCVQACGRAPKLALHRA